MKTIAHVALAFAVLLTPVTSAMARDPAKDVVPTDATSVVVNDTVAVSLHVPDAGSLLLRNRLVNTPGSQSLDRRIEASN